MNARRKSRRPRPADQRGQAAIILLLLIIGVGATILVYSLATPARLANERDRKTAEALAEAKAALIGFAAGVDLGAGASRPGDLPCPDMDDDGDAETSCGNAAGTTQQSNRLGRLPWRTLGLPDLRDGNGERLWYAVSNNFKNNTRTICTAPGQTGCLNSDIRGTITVRDRTGAMINDGTDGIIPTPSPYTPSGVIAVIIAPGRVLQRQGAASAQVRGCTLGTDCDAVERCTASPVTLTPKCNPTNYLDVVGPPALTVAGATGSTEDNADFIDSANTNGFINGDIYDANGTALVNDRLITISYQELMPLLERRVARETYNCMESYAAASNGRYPWAAAIDDSGAGDYSSKQGERFGRIPDSFSQTLVGTNSLLDLVLVTAVNIVCTALPSVPGCMSNSWPTSSCHLTSGSWWLNWKEHVFYGVAQAYQPRATVNIVLLPPSVTVAVPAPTACDATAGNYDCLAVSPPTTITVDNKRFVVIVAGKRLSGVSGGQPRSSVANKQNSANYLEDENGNNTGTSNIYGQQSATTTFNDTLLFLQ